MGPEGPMQGPMHVDPMQELWSDCGSLQTCGASQGAPGASLVSIPSPFGDCTLFGFFFF